MPAKRREQRTQATPLAEDVLGILRKQIEEGAFGTGIGPLQREAGTAARQFVSSGGGLDVSGLIAAMEGVQRRQVGEGAGDLREAFGIAGSRFGTPLATGEARFRRGAAEDFSRQTAETRLGAEKFNVQSRLAGIDLLNRLAESNLAPFFALAGMGIQPDVFEQNPFISFINALGSAGQGVAAARGAGS